MLIGSYNWTNNAEYKNAENLILIYNKHTNLAYKNNWIQIAEQAQLISLSDIEQRSS